MSRPLQPIRPACRAARAPRARLGTQGAYGSDRITRFSYNAYGQVVTEERAVGTPEQQLYVRNVYSANLLTSQTK